MSAGRRSDDVAGSDGAGTSLAPGDGDDGTRTDGGYVSGQHLPTSGRTGRPGRTVLALAATEYRLAMRGRWAIALTGLFAIFTLGLLTFSGAEVGPEGYDRTVASVAALAVYLVPLAAIAFGYDAVVGAEETGWLQALFAQPVRRGSIVLGTFAGRAVVLAGAVIVGFGAPGLFVLQEFGVAGWPTYVGFVLATVALALAFLALGVLVSTLAPGKTLALGLALLAWAWFVLVHDLLALGLIAAFGLPDAAITAMVLSNPTGVFRVLVLSGLGAAGEAGFAAIHAAAPVSPAVLVATLLAWIALPVTVAAVALRRRRI